MILRHIRQGPHYQPGPDIPPYRPPDERPRYAADRGSGRPAQVSKRAAFRNSGFGSSAAASRK